MSRSHEDSFVLEFIKVYYGTGNLEHLKYLLSHSKPECLTNRLNELQVIALFYDAVSSEKVPLELPSETLKAWKELAGEVALRNTLLENEGSKVIEGLSKQGVKCTLLKGFSLMEKLYGNNWIRPVSDIDILISPDDFYCVKDYLLANGFTIYRRDFVRYWDRVIGKLFSEQHFFKSFGVCTLNLDFHWNGVMDGTSIESQYDLDRHCWTENPERVHFGEIEVDCLNLEMLFIHCVDHLALHHRFNRGLKWFLDLCQFIVKLGDQLDWSYIRSIVTKPNSRKAFGITLRLIHEMVGNSGPAAGHWKEFWSEKGLPGEYSFYKKQLISMNPKTNLFLYQILFPTKIKHKFNMLTVLLFSGNTFSILGRQRPFLRPVYVLYKGVEELLLNRLQKKKKAQF
ncbi:hypothetical protein Dtox_1589 [Desulfofarcimen acetoxidans DSM 771]|uniref:Nucleotidyltransferase family protein n=1 Tax=Desulfofarcimen acetoxidans (strain ATCC 49208 / DSM 771 / KCTC 5769 / VKM B-1644 / 5575) TaxID=485916 RepID=C8VW96_DESAS|nr:nucleotidyltransferase family protein [Desulfofarcimen acetoxidans]ACV62448.1 hypothetical protein Dtox_1589 [Desulfofarcimen acetoxidans DSM 771]